MKSASSTALVSVVTPEFLTGSLTMLWSFLECNPWFRGDLVLIASGLDDNDKKQFEVCFERIYWRAASPKLLEAIEKLVVAVPSIAPRARRFLSLETFRIDGYKTLLYCDADLLFRDSIHEILRLEAPIVCCGDKAHHLGMSRDVVSFAEIDCEVHGLAGLLSNTFNAGLMVLDESLTGQRSFESLIAIMESSCWGSLATGHTDQFLYNRRFAGLQRLVGATHNYLLGFRKLIFESQGLSLNDAKVLHFNGRAKPWLTDRVTTATFDDPGLLKAYQYWYDAFAGMLAYRNRCNLQRHAASLPPLK